MKNCKIIVLTLMLSACSSVVTPYPPKINPSIDSISNNTAEATVKAYERNRNWNDSVLFDMESGRMSQINGDIKKSIKYYEDAIDDVKDEEERAIVSGKNIVSQAGAVLVNDNVIGYKGKPFEHTMLHTFQALNYVFNNDIENAAPEIRLAGDNQQKALENNQKEIDKVKEKSESSTNEKIARDFINKNYAGINETAGKVKSQFQNAYAFYIAGIVYELNGEKDQAYLDYKNAIEISPNNQYIQRDLIRLAKELGMVDDLQAYKRKFSNAYSYVENNVNGKKSEVVVLIEDGFVAQKEEVKFPLPIDLKGSLVTVAFPIYKKKYEAPRNFVIEANKKVIGDSSVTCDVNALAYRAFKDELTEMVVRNIIRVGARGAAQIASNKIKSDIGKAFAKIGLFATDYATENADLRGWYTLPANTQVFNMYLAKGTQTVSIKNRKDGKKVDIKVNVEDGKKSIVRVIKAGNSYYTQEVTL